MNATELRLRIARLKKEKKVEEERGRLRAVEREAISEAREAKRERRISGVRLGVEKAKVYKALPLPHLRPRDDEEAVQRAEKRAERAEAEASRRTALSQRRTETAASTAAAAKAEAAQKVEEKEAKRAQLLAERGLRAERTRPYREAVKALGAVGKGVGKVAVEIAKVPISGVRYLGKESAKYEREHPLPKPRERPKPQRGSEIDTGINLLGPGGKIDLTL